MHNPSFVSVVTQALAANRLPANRLELEVTEGVFMRQGTGTVQVLERVLDLGVRLSLDDFGTGYSSLGHLSRIRFSSIKIDRSFVSAAARGVPEALAIIRAVVVLARAPPPRAWRRRPSWRWYANSAAPKSRGYYFGRPLPVAEARAGLAASPGCARRLNSGQWPAKGIRAAGV